MIYLLSKISYLTSDLVNLSDEERSDRVNGFLDPFVSEFHLQLSTYLS